MGRGAWYAQAMAVEIYNLLDGTFDDVFFRH